MERSGRPAPNGVVHGALYGDHCHVQRASSRVHCRQMNSGARFFLVAVSREKKKEQRQQEAAEATDGAKKKK